MEQVNATEIARLIIPFVVIFAIFYFLFIRPQKKQQQKHKDMLESLKVGDKIVSYGGMMCEIIKVDEKFFTVRSGESVLRLAKEYVAYKEER